MASSTKNTHGRVGDQRTALTAFPAPGQTSAAVASDSPCSVTVPSSWPARNAHGTTGDTCRLVTQLGSLMRPLP